MKNSKEISLFENTQIAFESKSDKQLRKANLLFSIINRPFLSKASTLAAKVALAVNLPVKGVIKNTVFEHFCGGESIEESASTIEELAKFGIETILDYSVEGEESEEALDHTKEEILKIIAAAKSSPHIPFSVFKMSGLASNELLTKIGAGKELNQEEKSRYQKVVERVDSLCKTAFENDVPILIDAEETWIQDPIDQLVYEMMEKYNKEKSIVYNTYQMYRYNALDLLKDGYDRAEKGGYYFGAKLVRGAYMEKEREQAEDHGYRDPIHKTKKDTDECYDAGLKFCVEKINKTSLISGSHNEYSNFYLTELITENNLQVNDPRIWFAQLYGMSDTISFNLSNLGYNVVKYVPYGPVKSVMPYLIRRAEENTSVAGQSSRELTLIRKEIERRKK